MRVAVKESIIIKNKIDIKKYFLNMEIFYEKWHPDYKEFRFIKKNKEIIGSEFIFREKIKNIPLSMRCIIIAYSSDFVAWKSKRLKRGGSIRISSKKITQEVYYEIPKFLYVLGSIFGFVITREDLSKHIREELQNLKRIVES